MTDRRVRAEAVEEAAQFCEKEWGAWTIAEAMRAALTKATKETKNV